MPRTKQATTKYKQFNREMVLVYVASRFHNQATVWERMNACEGGGDVFEPINQIRKELKAYAQALRAENRNMTVPQIRKRCQADLGKFLKG